MAEGGGGISPFRAEDWAGGAGGGDPWGRIAASGGPTPANPVSGGGLGPFQG